MEKPKIVVMHVTISLLHVTISLLHVTISLLDVISRFPVPGFTKQSPAPVSAPLLVLPTPDDGYCHATTGLPKIGLPGPPMAAAAGPPDHLQHCRWSPRTNDGTMVGPPLP